MIYTEMNRTDILINTLLFMARQPAFLNMLWTVSNLDNADAAKLYIIVNYEL